MQTFLPYPDFSKTASCLDVQRLGKQRVETKQILQALECGPYQQWKGAWVSASLHEYIEAPALFSRRTPWYNHPAVRMWKGFENALAWYGWTVCWYWKHHYGHSDTLLDWFADRKSSLGFECPNWLCNSDFSQAHQSNLVRKNAVHYRKFFPDVPDNLPYIWPTCTLHINTK